MTMTARGSLARRLRIPAPPRRRIGTAADIHRQTRKDSGFTLLELLISMTLFLLVIAVLGGALRLGFRTISAAERKMDALERYRRSCAILMNQLQSAAPITYQDEDGARKFYMKGDAANLQFATNQSIWGGERGCVIVLYRLEAGSDGRVTLYASERFVHNEQVQEVKLFDDLKSLSFAYFGKDVTDESGTWLEEWPDNTKYPEQIKVSLWRDDGERELRVPLLARMKK